MGPGEIGRARGARAAGWPIGLALAALLVGHRAGEARRRASLNLALHELRRPLQALVLCHQPPGGTRGRRPSA